MPDARAVARRLSGRAAEPAPGEQPRRVPVLLGGLPYAMMAVVAALDVAAGSSVGLLPLVALGPAFAGLVGGWRHALVVGTIAVGASWALAVYDGLFEERRGTAAVMAVAGVTAAAVIAAILRQRRETELASVRSIADIAQKVLLRPVPRNAGPLRVAVSYTSAVAEARIGGDLYEVVAHPEGVRVMIGDVQGKGLAAVETAATVVGAFREAAYNEPDLESVGERVERAAQRAMDVERFVTAVIAEFHPDQRVTLVNYGHPPPLVMRGDGRAEFAEPAQYALPLGLSAHSDVQPAPLTVALAPGDQLLLYTDGVTEARDKAGDFYPLEHRAPGILAVGDPDAALDALRADITRHTGGPLHDDAAMLLLRFRSPIADVPTARSHQPSSAAGRAEGSEPA
jgi:serine phosphatase RsbU (regulator of sigma subunit)